MNRLRMLLGQVKRWLSLLREMQLPALVRLIQRLTQPPSGSPPAVVQHRPGAAVQSRSSFLWLPTRGAVLAALHRLRGSCRAIVELVPAVRRAAAALSGQLAHGFFVPFCLTATALVARIQARAVAVRHPVLRSMIANTSLRPHLLQPRIANTSCKFAAPCRGHSCMYCLSVPWRALQQRGMLSVHPLYVPNSRQLLVPGAGGSPPAGLRPRLQCAGRARAAVPHVHGGGGRGRRRPSGAAVRAVERLRADAAAHPIRCRRGVAWQGKQLDVTHLPTCSEAISKVQAQLVLEYIGTFV